MSVTGHQKRCTRSSSRYLMSRYRKLKCKRRILLSENVLGLHTSPQRSPGKNQLDRQGYLGLTRLAVTSEKKIDLLPDVPALGELMQGYEASAWYGLGAPKGTPAAIVDRLNLEVNAGLKETCIASRLADLGGVVQTGSPADFAKFIADETEKWSRVVRFSGAKVD